MITTKELKDAGYSFDNGTYERIGCTGLWTKRFVHLEKTLYLIQFYEYYHNNFYSNNIIRSPQEYPDIHVGDELYNIV
jgi:hypothetical protein